VLSVSPLVSFAKQPKPYITLTVDGDEIYAGDTIVLEVESTGLPDPLDLSVLSHDLVFERETTGTRIQVLGGKVVEISIRRMEFTPRKTGTLILGPLRVGEVVSNSVAISVSPAPRVNWAPDAGDAIISVRVSEPEPYVHQQVILTIELLHRYSVSEESYSLPDLGDFTVRPVYEERRTFHDSAREWRKIAWKYLLYPKRSGVLKLEPVKWSGTITKSRAERAVFERAGLFSAFEVRPSVANDTTWWLPASTVTLEESWSSAVTDIKAGDELIRTISIQAEDVLASQIPAPQIHESRAIVQTLIDENRQEVIEEIAERVTARSVAHFKYRVRAQSPIPVFLDTVRLPWWDTENNKTQEAIIPARRINVGLPEKAGLLKELAMERSGLSSFKLWVRDSNWLRLLVYGLAVVILIGFSVHSLVKKWSSFRSYRRIRKMKAELAEIAGRENWHELYQRVLEYGFKANTSNSELREYLSNRLYREKPGSINQQKVHEFIDQMTTIALSSASTEASELNKALKPF